MKKIIFIALIILSSIPSTPLFGKLSFDRSFDRLYGFFGKYNHESTIEKEFEVKQPSTLAIHNSQGDITITTEWTRNSICLKAIKKATKEEDLSAITVNAHADHDNELNISSTIADVKGCVDYELIVPAQTILRLKTDNGAIKINDAKGEINVTTLHGNIEIHNTTNTITAQSEESGSITISNALGNIKATTHKGNITIEEAQKSILATTYKGNITTSCSTVPATSRIQLNAEASGTIELKLPNTVNATLHGKTAKGRLSSDHYITLKPFTTKLTRQTRREIEKQVNGILGTGEADIRLTSNNGNIRILEIS